MKKEIRIRVNFGPMPFDRRGAHATGREVLKDCGAGMVWYPEYEDDDTTDLPETDPPYDEEEEDEYEE